MLVFSQKHQIEQLSVHKKYLHKNLKFQVRDDKHRNKKRHIEEGRKDICTSRSPLPQSWAAHHKERHFLCGNRGVK